MEETAVSMYSLDVLDSNRDTDEIRRDARRDLFVARQLLVRRRCRVNDELEVHDHEWTVQVST